MNVRTSWRCLLCGALLVVALGKATFAAELPEAARALLAEAEAAEDAGDHETALARYGKAVEVMDAARLEEDEEAAEAVEKLARPRDRDEEEVATGIRDAFRKLDALAVRTAPLELARARCLVALDRPDEAVRRLAAGLSLDPAHWPACRQDPAFRPLQDRDDYRVMAFLLDEGRAHLDTGRTSDREYLQRSFCYCLRQPPGSATLWLREGALRELSELVLKRAGAREPRRLSFSEYDRLVRLGVLSPKGHYGWAYRHSHLFERDAAIREIHDECRRRFEAGRDEPHAPFLAFRAIFPAAHLGHVSQVHELLDFLGEHALYYHERALEGLGWLIEGYVEARRPLPGASFDATAELEARVEKETAETRLASVRLRAWHGIPMAMYEYGRVYAKGAHGEKADPARAFLWYEGAAELGLSYAIHAAGEALIFGSGVEKDEKRGFELVKKVADDGDGWALNTVGYCYQYGRGVEQDYGKARAAFEKAADLGHQWACESYGLLLQRGLGGSQDLARARAYYEKGLEGGYARCGRRLGNLAVDARQSDADLERGLEHLEKAVEAMPEDRLAKLYRWAALQLLERVEEARAFAKAEREALEEEDGFERDLLEQMARRKIDRTRLLRKAKALESEDERATAIGQVYYLAGIQQLAAGKPKIAARYFRESIDHSLDVDSTLYSSRAELERMEEEE